MSSKRIHELMLQAGYVAPELAIRADVLSGLIIADICKVLKNWKGEPFPFDEDLAVDLIKEHFGIK